MKPYGQGPKSPRSGDGNGYCAPRDRGRSYEERRWRQCEQLPEGTCPNCGHPLIEHKSKNECRNCGYQATCCEGS